MKKAFRITILLCLAIATLLAVSACNKTPEQNTTPEVTAPEATTPQETTPIDPNTPVAVDTLNGMNATELYEKFVEEYFVSLLFDIELTVKQTEGDKVLFASSVATKINENSVYYATVIEGLMDSKPMEVWVIGDIAYINNYGEKIKREGVTTDEVLGEGTLEAVWGSMTQEISKEYRDTLANAQLYRLGDVYYYTVTVSMPDTEFDSVSETVYFDKNGRVTGVIDVADGYYMQSTVNAYGGEPVEILPPEDAEEYTPEITPVDTLNGMTAAQLFAKFEQEYNSSSTYDIQYTRVQRMVGMEPYTCATIVKGNGNNVSYSYKSSSYSTTQICLIDDIAYVNVDGKRFRYARVNVANVYGQEFLDVITIMTTREVSQDYYTALETAPLYYNALSNLYFFTVTLPATDENPNSSTETVYFDDSGRVVKIIGKSGPFDSETIISYNTPVEILPPENAEEYHIAPFIPQTEEQIYQFYVDACNTIRNAEYLTAHAPKITYRRAKEDKYLFCQESDTQYFEQWIIGNKGYIWINRDKFSQTAVNADFLAVFANAEESLHLNPLSKKELQNLKCYYMTILARVYITFEYVDESGTLWQYEFEFSDTGHYLDITVSKIVDGKKTDMQQYIFKTDREFQISTPY